jgi:hypothetical protein
MARRRAILLRGIGSRDRSGRCQAAVVKAKLRQAKGRPAAGSGQLAAAGAVSIGMPAFTEWPQRALPAKTSIPQDTLKGNCSATDKITGKASLVAPEWFRGTAC